MNTRLYFTLVAVVYLIYGLWYFLDPQGVSGVYGFDDLANPLSGALLQFLGIYCLATGVMCGIARNAERSPARTGGPACWPSSRWRGCCRSTWTSKP